MTDAELMCADYDGPLRSQVLELAENAIFMARKLKETRDDMGKTPLIVRYDNGGGQKGYRENPVFKAYNAMASRYIMAISQLESMLGHAVQVDGTDERPNRLEEFRSRSKKRLRAV